MYVIIYENTCTAAGPCNTVFEAQQHLTGEGFSKTSDTHWCLPRMGREPARAWIRELQTLRKKEAEALETVVPV